MTTLLKIQNASLAYQQKYVFADVNLNLTQGKWVALLGPSGVGKTSLLRMITGLLTTDEQMHGKVTASSCIAYMAQHDQLFPWLTVLQNTLIKTKLLSFSRKMRVQEIKRAKSLLQDVGLNDALDLFPHQLSGGMRQRVALARTLLENKPIILMDEPFSALDAITRYKLQDLSAQLLENKTVLFITHDPAEASRLAHEIYIMRGKPASLQNVVNLHTKTPRNLSDPDLITAQAMLFQQLMCDPR